MIGLLNRNIFKMLESTAEFILYVPWMFYAYFLLFQEKSFPLFALLLLAFVWIGLVLTDLWLNKKGFLYRLVAYVQGLIPVLITTAIVYAYRGLGPALVYALFLFICYMRGLTFALLNFKDVYSISKFLSGMGILMAAFVLALYYRDLNWFSGTLIWLGLAFIALSMIILNQLQLFRMFDMMNAEAYTTHKNVRLRNFLFSIAGFGLIFLIFQFKGLIASLSLVVKYIALGARYIIAEMIRWLIWWMSRSQTQSGGDQMSSSDFSQLDSGVTPQWVLILQTIMNVIFDIVLIMIVIFLLYRVFKVLLKWMQSLFDRYTYRADEERKFVVSWTDITERGIKLGEEIKRRVKRRLKRFDTPSEYVRFFYAEVMHRFFNKNKALGIHHTPRELYLMIQNDFDGVDPDLMQLTEIYDQARYSQHDISRWHVGQAKKYRDRLMRLKL